MSLKTVSIIAVSDDFCNGQQKIFDICDYLLTKFNLLQYQVKKITVIRDDELAIARELQEIIKFNDILIVFGNLNSGPIYRALAKLTFQELRHEEHCFKIASARTFTDNGRNNAAGICLQRIFILNDDNVKVLSSNIVQGYLKHYRQEPIYGKLLKIQADYDDAVIFLKQITAVREVTKVENSTSLISLQLSAKNFEEIVDCEKQIRNKFKKEQSLEENSMEDLIYNSRDKHVQETLEVVERCLHSYGPENVFVSFNGGKDCTVLLHLVMTVLRRKFPNYQKQVLCLYVRNKEAFSEQDKFIEQCSIFYDLEVLTICEDIKVALQKVLDERPNMLATFMGSRRTDPYCQGLETSKMTDADWPRIMRVSPLLDWHYADIWDYLLYYKVPYCKLYDMGYTSLGNAVNTIRNPCLVYTDVDGNEAYLPAYKLMNETKERNGRNTQLVNRS